MSEQSTRLVDIGRRTAQGQVYDVIDYTFEVTRGEKGCMVKVGITGAWHDEIPSLQRRLDRVELIKVAEKWLSTSLAKRGYDPLAYPEVDRCILVPNPVMDYFVNYWKIPDHI